MYVGDTYIVQTEKGRGFNQIGFISICVNTKVKRPVRYTGEPWENIEMFGSH